MKNNITVEVCFDTVFFLKKRRFRDVLVIALWQVQCHKYFPSF